jgi:RecB family exonuclease
MSENATVPTQEPATTPDKPEEKKFTQEEVNSFFNKRYGELMAKVNEYEEKAKKFDEMEEANKTELQKALEKAEKLETELSGLKKAESIREIREEVAKETGIPAHLLTGATEEECKAQAAAIADYAKPSPYPAIKDAGEVNNVGKATTRQQFADWASKMI